MLEGGIESASEVQGKDFVALPIGTTVGRYSIAAILGRGSFGITYRARDNQLNRDVAMKEYLPTSLAVRHDRISVLPSSTKAADDFIWGRERFVDEGRTLASLQRAPAIVRVYDFLEANGTAYIVMELVPGRTLEHRLRDGALPAAAIDTILWPLLDGLERVHATGFLHRDIKPANLLLDDEGHPTLIDFGASRVAIAGRTASMTAVFTPGYAAVEQMTSARQGPWTDIYGLSATLYHAIAGAPPPGAIDRVLDDSCTPLLQLALRGFRPELLSGIDAGLGVRAEQRPQSIADWRQLLRRGAPARAPTIAIARSRSARPAESPAASTMPAAPIVPTPPMPVAPRRRTALWLAVVAAIVVVATGGYLAKSLLQGPAVQSMTADELTRALEERRKADTAAVEKKKLEEEAQRRADADARTKAAADAALAAAQQQRLKAEAELAKLRAEMETRRLADEEQRKQAALAAQRALDEAAQKNRAEAEIAALRRADEEAKAKAAEAAAAKQRAQEEVQRRAEAEAAALRQAEEDARRKAAADAETQRKADEALAKAQAERQKADEAAAKQKAELDARQRADAEAKAKAEADAKAKSEAQAAAKAKADAEAQAKAEAAAKQKAEADAKAKAEADAAAEKKAAEAAETGLKLATPDRQHLQVALSAAGFDTRGSDGAFGPHTREMIVGWQKAHNQPATGFLTAAQQQALLKDGAAAIQKYDDDQKKIEDDKKKAEEEAKAKAASPPATPEPPTPAPLTATPSSGPYDGTFTGQMSGPGTRTITLQVTNNTGSGTLFVENCNATSSFTIRISPAGDVSGAGEGFNNQCVRLPSSISGRADNGQFQITMAASSGSRTATLQRTRNSRPDAPVATMPAAPAPPAAAFDGNYTGGFLFSQLMSGQMEIRLAGSHGSGTFAGTRCTDGTMTIDVSAAGKITGHGSVTGCGGKFTVSGQVANGQMTLSLIFANKFNTSGTNTAFVTLKAH